MATTYPRAVDKADNPNDPDASLRKEIIRRTERARLDRNRHIHRIEDCNKYALPWRHKINNTVPTDQLDDIYDETAMTVTEDFASDNLNTFTPRKSHWVDIKPVKRLDVAEQRQVADALKQYQDTIFDEMSRSNLHQALQESYPDLGIGTMAILIQDINAAEPIFCQAIPANELLIDRGPYAGVDLRAREWKACRGSDIKVLWPNARLDDGREFRDEDMETYDVIDGMWRVWSDRSTERWQYFVTANNKVISKDTYTGKGSCPMPVARWSRDSTTAWGVGPTYRSLPAIKTLNHIKYLLLKNLDKSVDPAMSYEDDGVVNLDAGVPPGMWVPRAVGSKAPEPLESKGKFDVAWVQADDLISSIKRAHYQDEPNQRGKTPPTAEQWADESARRMRRMGTPAANLVQELQYPIIERFGFLLAKRGVLPKVQLQGSDVTLNPISPLLRAQEMEEVVRADRTIEMFEARFGPQAANFVFDQIKYANWMGERTGFPKEVIRDAQQLAGAIKTFAPILGGGGGGGGPTGAPAAPPPVPGGQQ